ncbi:hypothetical protein TorRG33x02_300100 [Trema orientale]|uniref:Uncharacterized protein n=1 Tax=Trema orientale TaxID=63057 RepID=A0A2P5C2A4_TREOI|nr:hypothetical protein TorRG33x02_300100 [Trema orientale]
MKFWMLQIVSSKSPGLWLPEAYLPQPVGLDPIITCNLRFNRCRCTSLVRLRIGKGFKNNEFEVLVALKKIVGPSACTCSDIVSKDALDQSDFSGNLVDSARRLAQDTALHDVVMLENQLSILALKFILISELNMIALRNEKMASVILIIVNVSPKRNPDAELEEAKYIEEISEKVRIEMPEDEETSGAHHKVRSRKESESSPSISPHRTLEVIENLAPKEFKKPIKLLQGLLGLPCLRLGQLYLLLQPKHHLSSKSRFPERQSSIKLE